MSKVIFVISMSLDGFMTAANVRSDEPMGDGGMALVDWAFGENPQDRQILEEGIRSIGAVIAGRRTYDMSIKWWQANGPTGEARVPLFVVSHGVAQDVPAGGVYTFVDGIEAALSQAKVTAGDKDISVMGGAEIGQQFIKAGLVDEIQIHLVPVLLGSGTRLFDHLGDQHIPLETLEVKTGTAIHMRFRIIR